MKTRYDFVSAWEAAQDFLFQARIAQIDADKWTAYFVAQGIQFDIVQIGCEK